MHTALVVTVDDGYEGKGKRRRYVVTPEDEPLFGNFTGTLPTLKVVSISDFRHAREEVIGRFWFGAQWLRSYGRVDEMYRSLATYEVCKIERIGYARVWGTE